jgi:hypothetical protein
MGKSKAITFHAVLTRLTTTVDGGWRVSFDVAQSDKDGVMALSDLRECELALAIAPIEEQQRSKDDDDWLHGDNQ